MLRRMVGSPFSRAIVSSGRAPRLALNSKLVGLGDSIMAGSVGPSILPPALMFAGGRFKIPNTGNVSVGGRSLQDALSLDASNQGTWAKAIALSPDVIYCNLGVNDILTGRSAAQLQGDYDDLIARCAAANIKLVISTVARVKATATNYSAAKEVIRQTVRDYLLTKNSRNVRVVNLDLTSYDAESTTYASEGLHPTRYGAYTLMAPVGAALAAVCSTDSIYTVLSNNLITGALAGSSGGVATGWTYAANVSGLTLTASKSTKNGFNQQILQCSGTSSGTGIVTFYRDVSFTGQAGEVYDFVVDYEISGLAGSGVQGPFFFAGGTVGYEPGGSGAGVGVPDLTGVYRGIHSALGGSASTSRIQVGVYVGSGPVAFDIRLSRPHWSLSS